jgi:hypothetical protein
MFSNLKFILPNSRAFESHSLIASESEVNTKSNLQTRKHTTTTQQQHTLTQSNYNHLTGKNAPAYSLIAAQTAFSPSKTLAACNVQQQPNVFVRMRTNTEKRCALTRSPT